MKKEKFESNENFFSQHNYVFSLKTTKFKIDILIHQSFYAFDIKKHFFIFKFTILNLSAESIFKKTQFFTFLWCCFLYCMFVRNVQIMQLKLNKKNSKFLQFFMIFYFRSLVRVLMFYFGSK